MHRGKQLGSTSEGKMRQDTRITLQDAIDFLKDMPQDTDTGPLIQSGEAILNHPNPDHFAFVDWTDAFIYVMNKKEEP
jgi:hypothetical protein